MGQRIASVWTQEGVEQGYMMKLRGRGEVRVAENCPVRFINRGDPDRGFCNNAKLTEGGSGVAYPEPSYRHRAGSEYRP